MKIIPTLILAVLMLCLIVGGWTAYFYFVRAACR